MSEAKTIIKICGITSIEQALQIAELGVNAIGVISVKESPRYVPNKRKEDIFKNLKKCYPKVKRVSIVKNQPLNLFKSNLNSENVIQLHGDEDVDYCKSLRARTPQIELWKAFRIKERKDIDKVEIYSDFVDTFLLDSWNKDTYGGSGIRIQPKYLKGLLFRKPWLLAGGISADWIKQIIKDIKPDGIDISSSIESSPGIKDIEKTKNVIRLIRKRDILK